MDETRKQHPPLPSQTKRLAFLSSYFELGKGCAELCYWHSPCLFSKFPKGIALIPWISSKIYSLITLLQFCVRLLAFCHQRAMPTFREVNRKTPACLWLCLSSLRKQAPPLPLVLMSRMLNACLTA